MTDRERILAAIRGAVPDRLPWVPRLDFWYRARRRNASLPSPFHGLDLIEMADRLGVGQYAVVPDFTECVADTDMIDRALGIYNLAVLPYRATLEGVERRVVSSGQHTVIEYQTPVGSIRTAAAMTDEMLDAGASISYVTEYPIRQPADFEVVGYIFDHVRVEPQYDGLRAKQRAIGDRGIVVAFASGTACPMQHIMKDLMPVEQFFFAMHDCPTAVQELAERIAPYFDRGQQCAADSPAEVVLLGGNYDDAITYPPFFEQHILPPLADYAARLHVRGKYLMTHTDGENRGLLPLYRRTGFDIADSVCPHPMTSCRLDELLDAFAGHITLWGGIPSVLLCPDSTPDADFRRYIDDLVEQHGQRSRFILGVSDMVTADADPTRLQYITDRVTGG
jgi:uroporphyrinogen-III decarboxylase